MKAPQQSLQLSSTLGVNAVVWIRSLKEDEQRPTERVHDDLRPYLVSKGIPFCLYDVSSSAEFSEVLQNIVVESENGMRPILLIDTHGADKGGIVIAPTKERVAWEQFVALLRPINVATGNNLCVISAACFSLQSILNVEIAKPVPYFIYIAAEKEFYYEERKLVAFFKETFNGLDITSAYERYLSHQSRMYHCERALAIALVRYIRAYCIGSGLRARKERLLTEAIVQGMPNTRHHRRLARKTAGQQLKPTQTLIDRYVSQFLINKNITLSIIDVMRMVNAKVVADERALVTRRKALPRAT